MISRIWIIEGKFAGEKSWMPTVGAGLSRSDARHELKCWKQKNPGDKFRLRKYIRQQCLGEAR